MKRLSCLVWLLLLFGISRGAWAGAAEEIAELGRQRAQAFSEGDLDAWMAAYADDAVFTSSLVPFRIEGKDAIRAHYAGLFRTYPTRRAVTRQPSTRVYNNDTTAVTNGYVHVTYVDRNGRVITLYVRSSATWVKLGDQWRIVDAHGSRLPVSR